MAQVNVKRLKAMLTLAHYDKIIKALGIPIQSKSQDKWVLLTGCHHVHPEHDGSNKLWFYTESKIFTCFTRCSCSYDIIGLTQKRLGLLNQPSGFIDAVQFIVNAAGIEFDDVRRIAKTRYVYEWEDDLGKFLRYRRTGTLLKEYDKAILGPLEEERPCDWMLEGISYETLEKYHIGEYKRLNQITIPCFDSEGRLIGIRVRNKRPELVAQAKYMPLILLDSDCIYKFDTNQNFYGINYNKQEIERTQTVILVEGEKSVLKADTWWGERSNVLALYGSQIGAKRRNDLIRMGVKRVVLCLDSDFHFIDRMSDDGEVEYDPDYIAFERKIFRLARQFEGYCIVDVVYNNIGLDAYKCSPFDFDEATFDRLYENRVEDVNSLRTVGAN